MLPLICISHKQIYLNFCSGGKHTPTDMKIKQVTYSLSIVIEQLLSIWSVSLPTQLN